MTTTGQQRAAARLAAVDAANAVRYADLKDTPTRQQRRAHYRRMVKAAQRGAATRRGAYVPPRDRASASILKVWTVGIVEFAFHATKGLRARRAS